MSLKEQVRGKLNGMAPFSKGRERLEAMEGNQHVQIVLVTLDTLACAFQELSLSVDGLRGASAARLKMVAEALSAKLTYLLEPISPIEIDSQGCMVQLRSNPPLKDFDRTSYFELLVQHTGQMTLHRYSRPHDGSRHVIPAEITREVLLRLVNDFSDAIS